jgi:hypothetical protein
MDGNQVASSVALSAFIGLVGAMAAFSSGLMDGQLPNRGQPRTDFGGPIPIGTVMYKKTITGSERVVTDKRVMVVPHDDYSDPVILDIVGDEDGFFTDPVYKMSRAIYERAKVRCRSMESCRAYMRDGDEGLRKYEEWRKSVNADVNDSRYVFSDGIEISGDKIKDKKRSGQKIEYPSSIVWTSGGRPND